MSSMVWSSGVEYMENRTLKLYRVVDEQKALTLILLKVDSVEAKLTLNLETISSLVNATLS